MTFKSWYEKTLSHMVVKASVTSQQYLNASAVILLILCTYDLEASNISHCAMYKRTKAPWTICVMQGTQQTFYSTYILWRDRNKIKVT